MNEEKISILIEKLFELKCQYFTPVTIAAWTELLAPYPLQAVSKAIEYCAKTDIGHLEAHKLTDMLEGKPDDMDNATDMWANIVNGYRKKFDSITVDIEREMFGDHGAKCMTMSERPHLKREFISTYLQYTKSDRVWEVQKQIKSVSNKQIESSGINKLVGDK